MTNSNPRSGESQPPDIADRIISLGPGLPAIPERLLLAHARGQVLFIAGAGVSQPAGLPDFRELVLKVYERLDAPVHDIISKIPRSACNKWVAESSALTPGQAAEVRRFVAGDFDVVLGLLERRIDGPSGNPSRVRQAIAAEVRAPNVPPAAIHHALMSLADRGGSVVIVTTNFDRLLEKAASRAGLAIETYALGGIPRPGRRTDFAGILHIHGAIDPALNRMTDLILSDQDFGEFYLRRRTVSDFIYDAARLFNLVLVGYSANDPPMRYLLNAIAADGSRFDDLKERFAFIGSDTLDPIALEDWRGRGIVPIHYNATGGHSNLLGALQRWAALSAVNGKRNVLDKELKRIVRVSRSDASEADRDLFDHLVRRITSSNERMRVATMLSKRGADFGWLDAMAEITRGDDRRPG